MNHTVSALEVRKNLGEVLNRILYRGEEIIVERKGKPVAKIVPVKQTIAKARKVNIEDAATIRKSWARYQNEIGEALHNISKLPKNKRPLLFR
jgi:prevent-host-death family protein